MARLTLQDEARHVAFGLAHLTEEVAADASLRDRLRAAIERRHDALASTSGLASDVHDALVVLAAGSWAPAAIATGWAKVQALPSRHGRGSPPPPGPPRLHGERDDGAVCPPH